MRPNIRPSVARFCAPRQPDSIYDRDSGGPRVYSYEELLRALAREADLKRILISLPFAAWRALAWTGELLPNPPVTRSQVELMQVDNVCSPGVPGFAELGISPHSVESMLEQTLRSR